jgi:hypothetical protein
LFVCLLVCFSAFVCFVLFVCLFVCLSGESFCFKQSDISVNHMP